MLRPLSLLGIALVLVLALSASPANGHGNCTAMGVVVSKTLLDGGTSENRVVWLNRNESTKEFGALATDFSGVNYSNDFHTVRFGSVCRGIIPDPLATEIVSLHAQIANFSALSGCIGRTWSNETSKLFGASEPAVVQADIGSRGGVSEIIPSSDEKTVYFVGYDGRLWVTTNAGDSYSAIRVDLLVGRANSPIFSLQAHPTQPNVAALILTDPNCITQASPCTWRLMYSITNGLNWTQVNTGYHIAAPRYGFLGRDYPWWGFGPKTTDGVVSKWGIVFLGYQAVTGDYFSSSADVSFPELIIMRDIREPLSAPSNRYLHVINTVNFFFDGNALVATVFNASSLRREVWISNEFTEYTTTMRRARIPPPPDAQETSNLETINVLKFKNDPAIWLTVDYNTPSHSNPDYFSGDLYVDVDASSSGRFTWSIQALNQQIPGAKDITQIPSVEGAYIVNARPDRSNPNKWVSYMTWNKGARWDPIPIPSNFQCPGCTLNLLGPYSGGMIESSPSAPGILIADGWASTDSAAAKTQQLPPRTFISHNGGLTWNPTPTFGTEEGLSEGNHIFDILEHGAVLVALDKQTADHVAWSNVGGLGLASWSSCTFDPNGAGKLPIAIWSDPDGLTPQTLVVLYNPNVRGVGEYELWHLDFSATVSRDCTSTDYEFYNVESPSTNGTQDYCIMGRRLTYRRKNPATNCGNADATGVTASTVCTCSREDFICSDCFVPSADGTTCEFSLNCAYLSDSEASPPASCPTGSNYTSPITGYDLIAGNVCERGLDIDLGSRDLPCPPGRTGIFDQYPWLLSPGAIAGAVVGTLFVLLLLVAIGIVIGKRFVKRMDLKVADRHANFKDEDEDDELATEARTSDEPTAAERAAQARPGLDDSEDAEL